MLWKHIIEFCVHVSSFFAPVEMLLFFIIDLRVNNVLLCLSLSYKLCVFRNRFFDIRFLVNICWFVFHQVGIKTTRYYVPNVFEYDFQEY